MGGRNQPARIERQALADFAAFGVDVPVEAVAAPAEEGFPVYACNWAAVSAFLSVSTQWRAVGTFARIVYLGLDYVAVEARLRARALDEDTWQRLKVLEAAALEELNRDAA